MDKRYQVFVSSTYKDLSDERQEVIQALLELDCIPAGMELFPAANEDQWSLITKVIDDCDYYIVIVGGRYGSIGPKGFSYTEMEYRYALSTGKPIIAFIHEAPETLPANRTEQTPEGKEKLSEFKSLVQQKMCRFWSSPADLGSQVSRSIVKLIKTTAAVGWVRADLVPDVTASEEILRLKKRIEELESELDSARSHAPKGAESLSQGDDPLTVRLLVSARPQGSYTYNNYRFSCDSTWNDLFSSVAPLLIVEASEEQMADAMSSHIRERNIDKIRNASTIKGYNIGASTVQQEDFQTIKVQFRALGLITKSVKNRSVKDTSSYWTLTPYGDEVMTRLRAIRRQGDTLDLSANEDLSASADASVATIDSKQEE